MLIVTCHLRFWQNGRGLLRATVVTRGWNGYRNKSQHKKLTLEKKILPPLPAGDESNGTFLQFMFVSHYFGSLNHQTECTSVIFDQVVTNDFTSVLIWTLFF